MSLKELRSALSGCLAFCASPSSLSASAAEGLVEQIQSHVNKAAVAFQKADEQQNAAVLRQLVELGGALAELSPQLAGTLGGVPSSACFLASKHLSVALRIMTSCCALASAIGITASDAFRFAACGRLVLGCGQVASLFWLHTAASVPPEEHHIESVGWGSDIVLTESLKQAGQQVEAAQALLGLMGHQERTLAAFAAVAKPADTVRWLALIASILQVAHNMGKTMEPVLRTYTSVACHLLRTEPFAKHQESLEDEGSSDQADQLAALLPQLLTAAADNCTQLSAADGVAGTGRAARHASPGGRSGSGRSSSSNGGAATEAAAGWLFVLQAMELVGAACLRGSLEYLLNNNEMAATAALNSASRIVEKLPAWRSAGLPAQQYTHLAIAAANAWGAVQYALTPEPDQEGEDTKMQKLKAQLAIGGMTQFSLLVLQLGRDAELAAELAAQPEAVQQSLYASTYDVVNMTNRGAKQRLERPLEELELTSDHEATRLFALQAAATAALQLLHFLAERQLATPQDNMAAEAAEQCLLAAAACVEEMPGQVFLAWGLFLGNRLLSCGPVRSMLCLHAAACRLVHFAAGASQELRDAVPALCHWRFIRAVLDTSYQMLNRPQALLGQDHVQLAKQDLQSMAAAHLEASRVLLLHYLVKRAHGRLSPDTRHEFYLPKVVDAAKNVAYAIRDGAPDLCVEAAVPALLTELHDWQQWLPTHVRNTAFDISDHVEAAAAAPLYAAALVQSDVLVELLDAFRAVTEQETKTSPAWPQLHTLTESLHEGLHQMVFGLQQAARTAAAHLASKISEQDNNYSLCRLQAALLVAAELPLAPLLPEDQLLLPAAVVAHYIQRLHPTAVQLAAALQPYWRLPERQEAAQVALAQLAVTRSCAYLRCSNLAAGGEALPSQVPGSQKCSGCRVAWYCGTACSHADWRAGHKRVCKALAAARQAAAAAKADGAK